MRTQPLTTCVVAVSPSPPARYALVWSDEFNVDGSRNPKNWTFV